MGKVTDLKEAKAKLDKKPKQKPKHFTVQPNPIQHKTQAR